MTPLLDEKSISTQSNRETMEYVLSLYNKSVQNVPSLIVDNKKREPVTCEMDEGAYYRVRRSPI